jgi:hypothetical protein
MHGDELLVEHRAVRTSGIIQIDEAHGESYPQQTVTLGRFR